MYQISVFFCTLRETQKAACHFRKKALHKHAQYNLEHEIKLLIKLW